MLQQATYSNRGGRPVNEDTVLFRTGGPDQMLMLVADGLGGHGSGDQASQLAAKTIEAGWYGGIDPKALEVLILKANEAVLSIQTKQCAMKTTLVLFSLNGRHLIRAHAGDSRLYHFKDGRLVFQTLDHSVAQLSVLMGDITPDQIRHHEDRSRVLKALGQDRDLKIEMNEEILNPGTHAFLLCSDGFWEYVLESEMAEDLARSRDPQEWLGLMRKRLLQRVPSDNDNNTAACAWISL